MIVFTFDAVRHDDLSYMRRALELARQGEGTTYPNPRVGAVVVRAGEVVGEGFHRRAGEPHAEIHALQAAGEQARGATVYVNLEPCSHRGRTGPCADALISAGVAEVVIAVEDPNPLVAGEGARRLEAAGVQVRRRVLAAEAARLNEAFFHAIRTGRPFLHLKWAMTLDGKNAPPAGGRNPISGTEARAWLHQQRAVCDAVLVGGETVRIDNPQLTVRNFQWPDGRELRQPARVVVTNRPVDVRKAIFAPGARRIVLFGRDPGSAQLETLRREGVEYEVFPNRDGLHWERALTWLGEQTLREILVEAGPRLAGELIRKRLVQRISALVSTQVLGGAGSRAAVTGPDPASMADAWALSQTEVAQLGADILITGRTAAAGME